MYAILTWIYLSRMVEKQNWQPENSLDQQIDCFILLLRQRPFCLKFLIACLCIILFPYAMHAYSVRCFTK